MTQTKLRKDVLLKVAEKSTGIKEKLNGKKIKKFGINSFNNQIMREKLPKDVYKKLKQTILEGKKLDMSIAKSVAHALKEWATEKGVTHFTHWFQPLTGSTAEKHDAFLEIDNDGFVVERFRPEQLVQGEPDASSFPHGGRRSTFEARGYTAWDPSSPAFIKEGPNGGILCIPSVFISYNGEALDKKTPLLRAMEDINKSASRILNMFGNQSTRVKITIGTEQEYFLIDKSFYALRPDLQLTGRTLFGAVPPKGQELDDHYFGTIKERVLGFMQDVEEELYKLGIPAKTRHNEVAPQQFEIAPIYAEANIGADRNQLMMQVIKEVADRKGLAALMHEKPFEGINGSGKHNNWSIQDVDGNNLLDPGETPEENLQFLVFLVATLRAVYKYGDILRATVASSSNDHRLGANEAPPAIMSVFLGEHLDSILNHIKEGKDFKSSQDFVIDLGINKLPSILKDNTDRNRTSPFAFTGNKFEFRAPGSNASVSLTNTILSAAVSESLSVMANDIEKEKKKEEDFDQAVLKVLKKYIIETEPIRFEGDNYSEEWVEEAEKRGLPNLKTSGYAYDAILDKKNVKMLKDRKVFDRIELESLYNTKQEKYITELEIEGKTLINLVRTEIIPTAIDYQTGLIENVQKASMLMKDFDIDTGQDAKHLLEQISELIKNIRASVAELEEKMENAEAKDDLSEAAKYYSDEIVPQLEKVREPVDELEELLPAEEWPLPKYSEMLFMI
ncbi:MAG: glutamine synthetase III [Candidatus Marinimicrobia bacterium]|nr:glutamine synthetase III [Candidatus Neomarinimicrobiota bacterium]